MEWGLVIIFFIILAMIFIRELVKGLKEAEKLGAIEKISVGKYLVGLPDTNSPSEKVDCVITENDLIFIAGFEGTEIGRIPRNAINQAIFDDKSQISQRLTATRLVTLGIFSLAAPKKKKFKEYCLAIDWDDAIGINWNTVFEFSGTEAETSSSQALNKLKKYIKPKATILKMDEKKCPYCAEVIKNEAIKCKHCGSMLR